MLFSRSLDFFLCSMACFFDSFKIDVKVYLNQTDVCRSTLQSHILVLLFTGRNEVLAKVIFSQACVILFTGGSQGVFNFSGGGCLQFFGGSPIFLGGVSPIFLGVSNFFWGVSTRIQSMFGRYASYWNAFLFKVKFAIPFIFCP